MIANLAGAAAAVAMLLVVGLFLVYPLQVLAVAVFFAVTGGETRR